MKVSELYQFISELLCKVYTVRHKTRHFFFTARRYAERGDGLSHRHDGSACQGRMSSFRLFEYSPIVDLQRRPQPHYVTSESVVAVFLEQATVTPGSPTCKSMTRYFLIIIIIFISDMQQHLHPSPLAHRRRAWQPWPTVTLSGL